MFTTKALGQIVQEEAPEWFRPLKMVETPFCVQWNPLLMDNTQLQTETHDMTK